MTATETRADGWIPTDTFGARLALIRQRNGWNVKRAAEECGQNDDSWRGWEHGRAPRKMHYVAREICDATGVDYTWLMLGGPLESSGVDFGCNPGLALDWTHVFGGPAQLSLFGGSDVFQAESSQLDALIYTLPPRDRRRSRVAVDHDRRSHNDLGLTG